jgi:hypothetical protein
MQPRYSTTPKVYDAIVQVQAGLAKGGISKDRKNQQQNYAFRGIDDIYNALANHLAAAKLCILPRIMSREVVERTTKSGGALFYVVVDVEFDFVSAEDGSKHTIRMAGEAMDSADKATNKAMSAAYKYACLQTFCIPTEADNDADAHTHDVKPKQAPKQLPGNLKTADELPEGFGEMPITYGQMQALVLGKNWGAIGRHKLVTKCSRQNKTVKEVIEKDEQWVVVHIEELADVDQLALNEYVMNGQGK